VADLGEALQDALDRLAKGSGAGYEPKSEVDTWRGRGARMRAIEAQHGGPAGAARAVGVQLRTWKRWTGKAARLTAPSLDKLQRAARAVYDVRGLRAKLRQFPLLRIGAVINWDGYYVDWSAERDRPEGWRRTRINDLEGSNMQRLWAPWLAGDTAGLAGHFEAAVHKAYGVPVNFEGDQVEVSWE
jgi:hypothetical protein